LATPNILTRKPNRGSGLVWLVTIRPLPIQIPGYATALNLPRQNVNLVDGIKRTRTCAILAQLQLTVSLVSGFQSQC